LVVAPAVVHEPPEVAACTGEATPRIKNPLRAKAEIFFFTIYSLSRYGFILLEHYSRSRYVAEVSQ
jgi:hypothetical protein